MQSETLAQELSRLVKEYHEAIDHTKAEAWNLVADFAVDNADALTAALAEQTQQGVEVKKLGWITCGPVAYAITPFGSYEVRPNTGSTNERFEVDAPLRGDSLIAVGSDEEAMRTAAQSDYETRILSALVHVPAVEPEPVGEACGLPGSRGGFTMAAFKAADVPIGTKLYSHPPRSPLDGSTPVTCDGEGIIDHFFDDPLDCDCSNYETDLLEGSARCNRCGRSWSLSQADVAAEIEHQAAYMAEEIETDTTAASGTGGGDA